MRENTFFNVSISKRFLFLKYVIFLLFFFVYNSAHIIGIFSPSFFGFFLAFTLFYKKTLFLSICYLLSVVFLQPTVKIFVFYLLCCVFCGIINLIYYKKNKKISKLFFSIFSTFIGLIYIIINATSIQNFYISIVDSFLNVSFSICLYILLNTIKERNYNLNFEYDKILYLCLTIIFFFCGLQNNNIFIFDIVKFVGLSLLLFLSKIVKPEKTIFLSIIFGLGSILSSNNLSYLTFFSLSFVVFSLFKSEKNLLGLFSIIIIDSFLCLFLDLFSMPIYYCLMPDIISILIYLLIPKKLFERYRKFFTTENNSYDIVEIINKNKNHLAKKLSFTADVFYEMDKNFRGLVCEKLDIKNMKTMLCNEVIRKNCENCLQRSKCIKGFNLELKKVFDSLTNVGFEKGKISLIDLPSYLTNRCIKVNSIMNTYNELLNQYKRYSTYIENLDSSKMLIAEQLGGISAILSKLAISSDFDIKISNKDSQELKEMFYNDNIIPCEVVCFERDIDTQYIYLILRNIDFNNERILNILQKKYRYKMVLEDIKSLDNRDCSLFIYKSAPNFDIAIGLAQISKGGEDVCGDVHSISKIVDNKFMFAICDGMGHGERAQQASKLSISLIENFYKAGFDSNTIVTSVNSLLNIGQQDIFSALDVSVIDLKSGEVDFIKQGASKGFIKTNKDINIIESNSLPIGILERVEPKITKTVLTPNDIVIMVSDGIYDAFDEEELKEFLSNLPQKNPQELADIILKKAKIKQKNYPNDDMTVLVGKLFYNCA